jgi:hypothetical protein
MPFSSGESTLDGEMNVKGQNCMFHCPPEACGSLQHIFEKWVEHSKKHIACQWRYFEKETVHHTSTKFRLRVIK